MMGKGVEMKIRIGYAVAFFLGGLGHYLLMRML